MKNTKLISISDVYVPVIQKNGSIDLREFGRYFDDVYLKQEDSEINNSFVYITVDAVMNFFKEKTKDIVMYMFFLTASGGRQLNENMLEDVFECLSYCDEVDIVEIKGKEYYRLWWD